MMRSSDGVGGSSVERGGEGEESWLRSGSGSRVRAEPLGRYEFEFTRG